MYIKTVNIDGFKSYGRPVEVGPFDVQFNAITGMNGSGKSNILDAICFVMGINNLSSMRATNLQDLVFGRGSTGVKKASVSVTFDNRNKRQSPIGYDKFDEITVTRQIIIGGRNKFYLNGYTSQQGKIQDMFRSCQLNVNNPHFLIMQGRITKVINMKPIEILHLLEEAAGTRLYENKKMQAQQLIKKKDDKLKEIIQMLDEEIGPKVERLRKERDNYLQFEKVNRELVHVERLVIASSYVEYIRMEKDGEGNVVECEQRIVKLEEDLTCANDRIQDIRTQIQKIEMKRDKDTRGVLEELEKKRGDKKVECEKAKQAVKGKVDEIKSEEKSKTGIVKQIEKDTSDLKKKQNNVNRLTEENGKVLAESESAEVTYAQACKKQEAAAAGMTLDDQGQAATLGQQLADSKTALTQAKTDIQTSKKQLVYYEAEIKRLEAECGSDDKIDRGDEKRADGLRKRVESLEKSLEELGYNDGMEERLNEEREILVRQVDELRRRVERLACHPMLTFQVDPNDDSVRKEDVFGVLAKLFQVKKPKYYRALESVAGGKLFNLIVQSDKTAQCIFESPYYKGRRVTCIPLNRIQPSHIPRDIVEKAQQLVGEKNAIPAIDLIDCSPELMPAMKYVFGSTFICTDVDVASKVCFNPQVRRRCVTLEGDVFSPSGTLDGGSASKDRPILDLVAELLQIEDNMQIKMGIVEENRQKMRDVSSAAHRFREIQHELNLKRVELESLERQLQQSNNYQLRERLETLRVDAEQHEQKKAESEKIVESSAKKVEQLEKEQSHEKEFRDKLMRVAENELTQAKERLEASNTRTAKIKGELEVLAEEIKLMESGIRSQEEELVNKEEILSSLKCEVKELERVLDLCEDEVKKAEDEVGGYKEILSSFNDEVKMKKDEVEMVKEEANKLDKELTEEKKTLRVTRDEMKSSHDKLKRLLHDNPWVPEESQYFGKVGSAYDFKSQSQRDIKERLRELAAQKENLQTVHINSHAAAMLQTSEAEYTDLIEKKKTVLRDKDSIITTIEKLDEAKRKTLIKVHEKVSKDFGSIFSTLLPGTEAKLEPVEGRSVLDGLEVKVAFNDVWKESLTELSGGQRSLVALSLILAMLLFRPAPLYILDEVDAALDLSHTQNIGQIIRNHFKASQFIIVSLKDGMFSNANVLFQTKLVDGYSTVSRNIQRTAAISAAAGTSREDKENDESDRRRQKKKAKK